MKILNITTLSLAVALLPAAGLAQTQTNEMKPSASMGASPSQVAPSDKKFVREAAQGGMAEVELGKLATEKASSDEVKKFGQRMVDDHTKAGNELKQIAGEKGIVVSQQLSAKDKMTKDRLSKLSGEQFDKAYMADMVKDHTQDVADFQKEANSGADSDVKNFAAKTLPTLQDHLREAKQIAPMTKTASNGQ
jgi:putative membrane protein